MTYWKLSKMMWTSPWLPIIFMPIKNFQFPYNSSSCLMALISTPFSNFLTWLCLLIICYTLLPTSSSESLYKVSNCSSLILFLNSFQPDISPHNPTTPALIKVLSDPHFAGSLDQFSAIYISHHDVVGHSYSLIYFFVTCFLGLQTLVSSYIMGHPFSISFTGSFSSSQPLNAGVSIPRLSPLVLCSSLSTVTYLVS